MIIKNKYSLSRILLPISLVFMNLGSQEKKKKIAYQERKISMHLHYKEENTNLWNISLYLLYLMAALGF